MCGDGPRPVAQPARSNAAAAKGRSQGVIPRLIRLACRFGLLTVASLLWVCPSTGAGDNYVGVYQCASLVVDGRSGRCTSPPLVLYPDGTYKIWGEQGTYRIDGNQLKLSESKKHGRGRLLRGPQIVFKFSHREEAQSDVSAKRSF